MDLPTKQECTVSGSLGFVLRVSQIFGVAAVKFDSVRGGWRIRASQAADLYGKAVIFLMCFLTYLTLVWDSSLERERSFHFHSASYGMLSIADVSVISAVLLAVAYCGSKRFQHIITCLARLQKITQELRHYGPHTSFNSIELVITVWSLMSNLVMYIDYGILLYEIKLKEGNMFMDGMYLAYYMEAAMMKVLTLQLALILTAVLAPFNHINNCLLTLLQEIRQCADKKSLKSAPAMLHRLVFLYCNLCDIVHQIDVVHGIVLMPLIASYLLHLIMTPYNLITRLFGSNGADFYKSAIQYSAAAYHVVDLIIIVEPCHQTYRQMNRTKHLISQLMRITPPDNYALILGLDLFYKRLMFNEVVYEPMNMFTIHRALISTILGSVTTYLVVVIQL